MKRRWIEYRDRWTPEPMTFWVHSATDGKPWHQAEVFEPPAPRPVPGLGWPVYLVEVDGFTFRFASLAELEVCLATLGQRVLPTTRRLSEEHGAGAGPNTHWLSRLPRETKAWRYRQKAVAYLREALEAFRVEVGGGA